MPKRKEPRVCREARGFVNAARELGCDEGGAVLKKILAPPPKRVQKLKTKGPG